MTKITAYIPAYNASEYLARTIEGLLSQRHAFDEVLVIDDGSKDDSAAIAARYPRVRIVKHAKNRGLAAARNTAFAAARNELIASVDADVVAHPDWIATLLPHFDDPKVAGAGGILIEGVQNTLADRWRNARMAQQWGPVLLRNPKFLYGCNNILRKSAVLEAGGYNESLRSCGEDPDLAARLRKRGWDLVYDPAARSVHQRYDTTHSILDMYWRWWRFGNQSYSKGISLRSVLGHALFVHFRYNFLPPALEDLRAGQFDLLALDLVALGYLPYRDFRLWLDSRSASLRQQPATGA
jgi:glycosyltransferase involved in cell wall biosynthesis